MKTLKLMTAALALLATAAFSTHASAQTYSGNEGDLILGMYDSSLTVTNSYLVDLGSLAGSPLTNGETWNLGSDISSVFSGHVGTNLVWAIGAAGGSGGDGNVGPGSLGVFDILITAPSTSTVNGNPGGYTTENTNILGIADASASSIVGTSNNAGFIANSNNSSFEKEVNNNGGNWGLQSAVTGGVLEAYNSTSVADLYYLPNASRTTVTEEGTFQFNATTGVLTFDAVAVPEPSTYALMLGGLLLLWVLKRRSSSMV